MNTEVKPFADVELVEKAGDKLEKNTSTSFIFSPPAKKRFISHGIKMTPNYGSGLTIRISLLRPNGAFRAFVHNGCGTDVTLTLQALQTDL